MFRQSGGGVGPWQGQNNMDPETLAQTLVSVAQNLLSSRSQQNSLNSGNNRARPSPWATQSDNYGQKNYDQDSNSGQRRSEVKYSRQERDDYSVQQSHSVGQKRAQSHYSEQQRDQANYSDQPRDHSSHSGGDESRSMPGRSNSYSRSYNINSSIPKPLMGHGLLGAPPDGDYQSSKEDPSFVIGGENQSYEQGGCWGQTSFHSNVGVNNGSHGGDGGFGPEFGIPENRFVEKVNDRGGANSQGGVGYETEKSRKNYRPKIKEDGCPPKYSMVDFEQVATKFFRCTMCNKDMWNSVSFVNHIKGNAHNKVVEEVAAKEASTVAEVRKQITELLSKDVARSKKGEKSGKCNMCGLKVVKDMVAHRRTDYHQQLKMFIHPHCKTCDADFEDRSDWYYHKFSAEHLTSLKIAREGIEYDPMSLEKLEKLLNQLQKRAGNKSGKDAINNEKSANNVDKNKMFKEMKAFADKQGVKLSPMKKCNANIYDDDITIIEDEENIGAEFIKPVSGLWCSLCNEFFGAGVQASAISHHCKTVKHLQESKKANRGPLTIGTKRSSAAEFFSSPKKKK